ncbi:acetyl-CoA synthetase-like protein [Daldinia caldariorum]|uniref:acetyl-CoA synthetase-like protein n=1 Tax=Daldinia caldariorum TaxID=326644 RepID=UPI002007850A|nr:acetyl-CoA synthetase-like protein [Daldinia caldariorum]KAI1466557.1 acetyl-CoA synthetase-like protein [Daldinia caldariorum]
MVFTPPAWVPQLPFDPPDSIPIHEFWSSEKYGRQPLARSRNPYTCGITGKTYTAAEMTERYELLARSLAKRMGWRPNEETPWDKVVGVFSFNSIDYMMSTFAVHRLSGIVTPANAMYSAAELEHQLKSAGVKALITCIPLLDTTLKATRACGIPDDKVFIMQIPGEFKPVPFKSLNSLIDEGRTLAELEPLAWAKGQGARQVAYLCYSSGTSGLPKAVMIAHRNVIANMMQIRWHEDPGRRAKGVETQVQLGLLPLSHIYGLVVVSQGGTYRGDAVIVLPKFELKTLLEIIQRYKINFMHIVPPIVIQMLRNLELCAKYDLSSVRMVYTGAAPLGAETHEDMIKAFPFLNVGQGYGMTETSTVITSTGENDVMIGTSGCLAPACRAKLIGEDGKEITEYEKPGELWVQSPSVTLGYLNNEKATSEAYVWDDDGRWMRTGDVAVVRKSPAGYEHIAVVDRLKELIKVKGHQVAPAELEAHLLSHPSVNDCAVIPVPDEGSGEVPKAFVVKSASVASKPDEEVAREIGKWVEEHKARYKWLKGGIEFIDAIPKSPSGKILRRFLRDREKETRRATGAKL